MSDHKRNNQSGELKYYRDSILQSFSVSFNYPVFFTQGVFEKSNKLLMSSLDRLHEEKKHSAVVYVDSNVAACHPGLIAGIKNYFDAFPEKLFLTAEPQLVSGGPSAKSELEIVRDIMTLIGNLHIDRQSYVIAIGGGSVLDMVGFSASLVHRGLRFVRIPSTTLAQGDAGIGIKNGMDIHGQKNFVGTFSPPFAVLNDFSLLSTLKDEDWQGGVAEAFKVAIIKDAEFFDFLCKNGSALRSRNQELMEQTICCCAGIHLEHIRTSGDPFELGSARPLDFGHWAGHQLENMSGYSLGHGQGVAIGIALDSFYAMRNNFITQKEYNRIIRGLTDAGLPVWHELLKTRSKTGELEVLKGLALLHEHLGGKLNVTLPDGIGRKLEINEVDANLVEEAVKELEKYKDRR